MKKILSLMALLMLTITATAADDVFVYWKAGTSSANDITVNGIKIAITGKAGKNWSQGNGDITINETAYKTIKNSNGAQNTATLPEGKKATKVVFYAVANADSKGVLSEFNGESCSNDVTSIKDYSNPTVIEKTLSTPANSFTFTFSTQQVCFIMAVTYEQKVYFDNTKSSWGTVKAYAWNGESWKNAEWPGENMTYNGSTGLFEWTTAGNPTYIIFNNGSGDQTADLTFEDGATYDMDGKVVILNDYTVNLTTDAGWENAYAYTWTGDTHELGDWPGTPMTSTGAGTWTITVKAENAPANIIFHNNEGDQTKDLDFVDGKAYEYMEQHYTATFTTDAGWETVYAYAWTTEGLKTTEYLGAWPGTPITATAGVYTATINTYGDAPEHIQFNNGSDGKTPDLVFTEGRAYKWNTKVTPLYALAASEVKIPAGTTVNVTDAEDDVVATLTYGVEGGADFAAPASYPNDDYAGFTAYTAGNGENGSASAGTVYIINPVYDGKILVGVWLNANKNFYITEDGNALEGFNGITIPYKANTAYEFDVKAGSEYKVYCTGSKLGFFGFDYTFDKPVTYTVVGTTDMTGTDPAWKIDDANNMVLNGETGLYEWTNDDIIVSSTTIPEFKVVKNGTTYYPAGDASTNWKITLGAISADVAGKYNLKITFNPSTDAIGVTATEKTAEEVTIGASGWATTVTNSPLDFSAIGEYVEAYTATLSGTTVTLNKVENVPAETGLVLKGATGTHYIPVIASSSTAKGNLGFSSTLTYTVDDSYKKCFGLTIKNEKAQFVKIKNAEVIPAQKAFLEVEPSTPANEFTVVFEDESGEATGIQTLNAERNTLYGETYNLAGQKVNKSYKGLVISNGIKVVIK